MIKELGEDTARWFPLEVTLLPGPSRMLMGAARGGIDAQVPTPSHTTTMIIPHISRSPCEGCDYVGVSGQRRLLRG